MVVVVVCLLLQRIQQSLTPAAAGQALPAALMSHFGGTKSA